MCDESKVALVVVLELVDIAKSIPERSGDLGELGRRTDEGKSREVDRDAPSSDSRTDEDIDSIVFESDIEDLLELWP